MNFSGKSTNSVLRAIYPLPVYIDETWYGTHDTIKKMWSDDSGKCQVSKFLSEGKKVVICHAVCKNGFIPNSLLLRIKSLAAVHSDYQMDMNAELFETWFEKQLLPNAPQKCVFIIDTSRYRSRTEKKIPNMPTRKSEMIEFMIKRKPPFPEPVPTKPVLLQKIKLTNIQKEYATDNLAKKYCHIVLRLPPYHRILNSIELVWSQLKHCVCQNVFSEDPEKLMDLIWQVRDPITPKNWSNFVKHAEKGKCFS